MDSIERNMEIEISTIWILRGSVTPVTEYCTSEESRAVRVIIENGHCYTKLLSSMNRHGNIIVNVKGTENYDSNIEFNVWLPTGNALIFLFVCHRDSF